MFRLFRGLCDVSSSPLAMGEASRGDTCGRSSSLTAEKVDRSGLSEAGSFCTSKPLQRDHGLPTTWHIVGLYGSPPPCPDPTGLQQPRRADGRLGSHPGTSCGDAGLGVHPGGRAAASRGLPSFLLARDLGPRPMGAPAL